jgi:hypothetical protein
MLLERLLLILLVGAIAIFLIGIPLFKLIKLYIYQVKDPVESAQARLERARKESTAIKLDKETVQLYEKMYKDEEPSVETKDSKDKEER